MPPHCMRARHYFSRENTICRLLTFRASEISFNGPKCFSLSHEIPVNSTVSFYLAIYRQTFWTPNGTNTKGFDPGFSIEFCAAVAVVVRGVTQMYIAKGCVYYVERGHLRETWAPIQYGGHISTLWRLCEAIVGSFCGLVICYSFRQLKPKKGTLQKKLTGNSLRSHLLKKSFFAFAFDT